jgi:hypothetical protein
MALPGVEEVESRGLAQWKVGGRLFVWERPLRKSDLQALADAAPEGPILGARVEHLVAKEALLQDGSGAFFTIPHFDSHPIVLVRLDAIGAEDLREVIVEAWLDRAPKRLLAEFETTTDPGGGP